MRKIHYKVISLVLCCFAFFTVFTGCGTDNGKQKASMKESDPKDITTVRIWTNNRSIHDLFTKMVEEFNSTIGKKEGIVIDYKVYSDDFKNVYEMAHASGQAPELHGTQGTLQPLVDSGWIVPIEDMPGGQELLNKYPKEMFQEGRSKFNGKTYSLPFAITPLKLVYNKELFKKAGIVDANGEALPPKTWAEVVEDAKKITQNGNKKEYGIALPMKGTYFWDWEVLNSFVPSVGAMYFDHAKGKFNFSAYKPAFTDYLLKLQADKSYLPGCETMDNDVARAQFSEGNVGMKIAVLWDVAVYNQQFPAKIDWGVTDVPVLDPNHRYKEYVPEVRNLVRISDTAKKSNPEKVMKVYKWLSSDEFVIKMYEEGKYIPFNTDLIKQAKKEPEAKGWKAFSNIDTKKVVFDLPRPEQAVPEGDSFYDVFTKLWFGVQTDVDKTLADLDARYNKKLKEESDKGKININNYIFPNVNYNMD